MEESNHKTENLIETWANEENNIITVGNNDDDIIEIIGGLKSGKLRTRFKLIISHDGVSANMDYQMMPFVDKFKDIFTGVSLNIRDIDLTYNVGAIGDLLKINAIINKYKI